MKNIAIYHPWIFSKGGCERVILELVSRLKNYRWTILTNYFDPKSTFPEFSKYDIEVITPGLSLHKDILKRGAVFSVKNIFTQIKSLSSYDLLIISTAGVGELITLRNHDLPTIVYCHTPLRIAYEFYDAQLHKYRGINRILFVLIVNAYKVFEKLAWQYFDVVITNSEYTKNKIIQANLAKSDAIMVISPGGSIGRLKESIISFKYFLSVGRITACKRFELAIEAFKLLPFSIKRNYKLIIAGDLIEEEYLKLLRKSIGDEKQIVISIAPTDSQLELFYRNCYAFIFTPSKEEWGIAAIEAMTYGKPVLSVNEGGMGELISNKGIGVLVDPCSKCLSQSIKQLVKDPLWASELGQKAQSFVRKYYNWNLFANKFEKQIELKSDHK